MRWIPLQGKEAASYGIPADDLERALHLVGVRNRTAGFAACKRIFARLPLFWLLAGVSVWITPWSLVPLAILFSPLSNPIGNRAYGWVARNRYRFPGSTCRRPF
jgi:predicted DCC family thiol-disulfide oxidoreductase YuxK